MEETSGIVQERVILPEALAIGTEKGWTEEYLQEKT